jgi:hypothetical protein
MTTEQLLRDALREDAGTTPLTTDWSGVLARGTKLRRRRRVAQGAVALVAGVAVTIGVLAVAGTFSDGGRGTRRGVVATPPGAVSDRIAVDRGDRIDVISATDGHVVRTVTTVLGTNPGGVSVTPEGPAVVYMRPSSSGQCGPELVEQPLTAGGQTRVLVPFASDPLVSPDGHWVAYVMNESCARAGRALGDFLGITDLRTGANYRPDEQSLGEHPAKLDLLAWSPDSGRVVYNEQRTFSDGSDEKTFVLTDPPLGNGAAPTPLPGSGPISAAAFLSNDRLLVAQPTGSGYELLVRDGASGRVVSTRFRSGGASPSAMALDPSGSRLLLVRPDGTLFVQEGTGAPRVIAHNVQSAAWLPAG